MKACAISLVCLFVFGCAGDMAAREAIKTVGVTTNILANKIPIKDGEMTAEGSIDNPKYTVLAGMFNGAICVMELDGVKIGGTLAGRGEDGENKVDPELEKIIKETRNEPITMVEKILEYVDKRFPASQPVK